jgi:hypothetical protein
MRFEALVFDGDDGLTQNGSKVIVADNLATFEGKRANHSALYVVEFGGGGGAVALQIVHLGKVDGVNEGEAGKRAGDDGEKEQRNENDGAGELAPMAGRQGWILCSARAGKGALRCRGSRRGV